MPHTLTVSRQLTHVRTFLVLLMILGWSGLLVPLRSHAQSESREVGNANAAHDGAEAADEESNEELDQVLAIVWEEGPAHSQIGDMAGIDLPAGFRFTGSEGTRKLLERMQNPTNGSELGLIMPQEENAEWFVVFEFSDVGYVKDDDRDKLDKNAILESITKGTEASNQERADRGWAPLQIVGWKQPPKYDPETNNLEWAVLAESEGETIVNHNTRLLGRHGVMEVSLVASPEELESLLPRYHKLLEGFSYNQGARYAEFKAGDRIAKYGLTALIGGGAAAVALKSGLLQKFGKLIVLGVVAAGAFLKKLFGGGKVRPSSNA